MGKFSDFLENITSHEHGSRERARSLVPAFPGLYIVYFALRLDFPFKIVLLSRYFLCIESYIVMYNYVITHNLNLCDLSL